MTFRLPSDQDASWVWPPRLVSENASAASGSAASTLRSGDVTPSRGGASDGSRKRSANSGGGVYGVCGSVAWMYRKKGRCVFPASQEMTAVLSSSDRTWTDGRASSSGKYVY